MKKRVKSRIPKFKTYEEEANFWDTHDITDFEDETEDVKIIWALEKPRNDTLVLRLQKSLKKRLENVARNRGLNVSTLARMWLIEKLQTATK